MMAASKPTSQLSSHTHFLYALSMFLGTLADDLGCFPLDYEAYPPQSHSQNTANGIHGLVGVGKLLAPESIQSPTSTSYRLRLYLNTFRGEPAISWFVWHFTPTHSSSHSFATLTSSGLHSDFIEASPWPWVAHQASGLIPAT